MSKAGNLDGGSGTNWEQAGKALLLDLEVYPHSYELQQRFWTHKVLEAFSIA
jgi:hypothetical protein